MSHYDYSRKALLFSSDRRVEMQLRKSLSFISIELEKNIPNLSSLNTIKTVAKSLKGTGFMRAELFNFIQTTGFPYLVIMDFRLDLGLDTQNDPGNLKLLKTFLISYIIFSMGRGFDKLHLNLLLIYNQDDTASAEELSEKPERLLSLLHTKNDEVNALISRMKNDNTLFKKIFSIRFVARQGIENSLDETIKTFNSSITARNNLTNERVKKSLGAVQKGEKNAADVYYLCGQNCYQNGTVCSDVPTRYQIASPGSLYVEGYWISTTTREVADRIIKSVATALKAKGIQKGEDLVIHLQEKCIIDGTTATALTGLIIQHLQKLYNGVSVKVSRFNEPILKNSQGFSMIKEYLVYED
ncbi:MAG TPA: hypothetical protein P5123_08865 [Spirochaetota bacterium]|nr:hypothetical protein [Spirochaetota bacterium]